MDFKQAHLFWLRENIQYGDWTGGVDGEGTHKVSGSFEISEVKFYFLQFYYLFNYFSHFYPFKFLLFCRKFKTMVRCISTFTLLKVDSRRTRPTQTDIPARWSFINKNVKYCELQGNDQTC